MRKERLALSLSVIGLAFCAGAQSLDKEIKVQRDIIPEHRKADRLPILPVISLPPVTRSNLDYSLIDKPMKVTPSIYSLPVNYPDVNYNDIYPGYANLGYFPLFNANASAGYRLINTAKTRLGGWVQYNGRLYRPKHDTYIKQDGVDTKRFSEHAVSVGVNLNQRTSAESSLKVIADYSYYHYCMPSLLNASQGANNFNGTVAWRRDTEETFFYGVSAGFSRFAFINDTRERWTGETIMHSPVRQNLFDFNADGGYVLNDFSKLVLGVEFDYLDSPTKSGNTTTKFNTWLVRLTPGYRYVRNNLNISAGLKVDITDASDKPLHVAPDVKVVYKVFPILNVRFEADGGEVQNTAASIFDDMPYLPQFNPQKNSHIPVTLNVGATLGVIKGFYFDVFGGWAKANEWLMPVGDVYQTIAPVNVSSWHVGATIGYHHADMLDIKLKAETVSGNGNIKKSYYLWRDRAKYVVDGTIIYTPIKPLDFSICYTLRGKRKAINHSLGDMNILNFGAKYRINEKLAVYLTGENLLNKRYFYVGDVPSQGITGLAGVTMKF